MEIIRDGRNIELTPEEVRAAVEELHNEECVNIAKTHAEILSVAGLLDEKLLDENDYHNIAKEFKNAIFGFSCTDDTKIDELIIKFAEQKRNQFKPPHKFYEIQKQVLTPEEMAYYESVVGLKPTGDRIIQNMRQGTSISMAVFKTDKKPVISRYEICYEYNDTYIIVTERFKSEVLVLDKNTLEILNKDFNSVPPCRNGFEYASFEQAQTSDEEKEDILKIQREDIFNPEIQKIITKNIQNMIANEGANAPYYKLRLERDAAYLKENIDNYIVNKEQKIMEYKAIIFALNPERIVEALKNVRVKQGAYPFKVYLDFLANWQGYDSYAEAKKAGLWFEIHTDLYNGYV